MKNKKIDNLFKNKLAQHEVAPRADAWAKLEDKMAPKKSGYMVYWRMAAVLILLITSVFVLYDFNGGKATVATTEDVKPEENEVKDVEDKNINNDSETQLADTEHITKEEAEDDILKQIIKRKIALIAVQQQTKKQRVIDITTPKEQQELIADNSVKEKDLIKESALNLIDKIENDKAVAVTENIQDTPNKSYDFGPKVVITFKKNKVEEKEAIASTKDDENKKRKLFRKVLNFAKDIKSKNIGIASIREAKDEMFTSRSKKQKQEVNPK